MYSLSSLCSIIRKYTSDEVFKRHETDQTISKLVTEAVTDAHQPEIKVMLEVVIDAEDLVIGRGRDAAQRYLDSELEERVDEIRDMLIQSLTEIAGYPVAVRDVKIKR